MKTLDKYVKCEGCGNTLVKKVYVGYGNKPLCQECRGSKRKSKEVSK